MSNTTTICGNLTREPDNRYTKEGQAHDPARRGRQPALAGQDQPPAGGDHVVFFHVGVLA